MTDKYYRLVTILVNICPGPLRELFLKLAAAHQNQQTPYTTLDAYLAFRKKDIMKLRSRKLLRQDQNNLLFPPQGQCQADINTWDITLLSLMLTELFKQQLQQTDLTSINCIRDIRNDLQHISGTCQITEPEFVNMYQQFQSVIVQIALSAKGQAYADKIKQDIESAASSVLVDLGDVLRQWYTAEITKLNDKVEQLQGQIDEIKEDTSETRKTLKKTTVKRTRPGGKITKRFKTVDHILDNMRGSFASLMKNESLSDFQGPPETARNTSELEEHHLVVVSGYGKGLYLQTALSVIESRDYDEDRCVVVSSPSDWRHIGAEDADLVVFLHPFGRKTFDEDKAKSMNAILDDVKSSTSVKVNDEEDLLDVVIITDQSILEECKKHFSHDLIETPIIVYKPTTEDSPVDLVEGETVMYKVDTDPHYKNMIVQSIAYCKYHRMQLVDDDLKEDALELFRSKKVIVITGPRGSGKTTLALSLLASYQEGHYLILTEPDDLGNIKFDVTCVVVIEDLGGKYSFEMPVVQKWLRKFDILYPAVKDGKLNVIITCVADRLNACAVDTSKHPMLEAVFPLPEKRVVKIKQEPTLGAHAGERVGITFPNRVKHQNTTTFTRVKTITSNKIDSQLHTYGRTPRFCQHPDGSFLVIDLAVDNDTETDDDNDTLFWVLRHFDADFQYIRQYNTDLSCNLFDDDDNDICCTDSGEVVIKVGGIVSLYRITNETLQVISSTRQYETSSDYLYKRLHSFKNRIYMYCWSGELLILDTHLNEKKKIELMYPKVCDEYPYVVLCLMQTFFYVGEDYVICECPKQKQLKYLQEDGFRPRCICAASEDSVFVLGKQGEEDGRILQVNTDMEILSDILLEDNVWDSYFMDRIVFDRVNARLIMYNYINKQFKQMYLE